MGSEDTETLLALVSSLLEDDSYDHATLLDALVQSEGDVQQAAQLLNSRKHSQSPAKSVKGKGKEKTQMKGGLDGWLKHASSPPTASSSTSGLKRPRSHSPQDHHRQSSPSSKEPVPSKKPKSMSSSTLPKGKRVTNEQFMALLRPPNVTDIKSVGPTKFPPLTLTTPEQVAKHTPCTLHTAVLPPELACRLFYAMMDDSESWQRNKWWLFDRVVESPHRTSFFVRRALPEARGTTQEDMQEAAQFWYNGRQTAPPEPFPPAMEEACSYIEKIVNAEMHKRDRYPLEWGGEPPVENQANNVGSGSQEEERVIWRANVAASNRYEGSQEAVGFHSDQLTNLGPYPTIASLSLGTTRVFRLREVIPTDEKNIRSARTYNMPLAHNTLVIMHASCQEMFKHSIPPQRVIDPFHPLFPHPRGTEQNAHPGLVESVSDSDGPPPSNARINVTFRFYRPDFRSSTTPRCNCGIPCILRPDMKNRYSAPNPEQPIKKGAAEGAKDTKKDVVTKYWWTCYAGAQNDGKGCGVWKVMDVKAEGRGPFAGDVP